MGGSSRARSTLDEVPDGSEPSSDLDVAGPSGDEQDALDVGAEGTALVRYLQGELRACHLSLLHVI